MVWLNFRQTSSVNVGRGVMQGLLSKGKRKILSLFAVTFGTWHCLSLVSVGSNICVNVSAPPHGLYYMYLLGKLCLMALGSVAADY